MRGAIPAKQLTIKKRGDTMKHSLPVFPPLELETRSHVGTNQAAFYLNRQPQTMRIWACLENSALRPMRISGRLAWPVADIKRLLAGG